MAKETTNLTAEEDLKALLSTMGADALTNAAGEDREDEETMLALLGQLRRQETYMTQLFQDLRSAWNGPYEKGKYDYRPRPANGRTRVLHREFLACLESANEAVREMSDLVEKHELRHCAKKEENTNE